MISTLKHFLRRERASVKRSSVAKLLKNDSRNEEGSNSQVDGVSPLLKTFSAAAIVALMGCDPTTEPKSNPILTSPSLNSSLNVDPSSSVPLEVATSAPIVVPLGAVSPEAGAVVASKDSLGAKMKSVEDLLAFCEKAMLARGVKLADLSKPNLVTEELTFERISNSPKATFLNPKTLLWGSDPDKQLDARNPITLAAFKFPPKYENGNLLQEKDLPGKMLFGVYKPKVGVEWFPLFELKDDKVVPANVIDKIKKTYNLPEDFNIEVHFVFEHVKLGGVNYPVLSLMVERKGEIKNVATDSLKEYQVIVIRAIPGPEFTMKLHDK